MPCLRDSRPAWGIALGPDRKRKLALMRDKDAHNCDFLSRCAAADSIDIRRFERLAEEGRRALAENAPDRAAADLREALRLWRGAPLADVSDEQFAQPEITRLNDLRTGIIDDRIEADLAATPKSSASLARLWRLIRC